MPIPGIRPPLRAAAADGASDPYFAQVVLLAHMDGADGATTFVDVKGHTLTANGNAQIDTAQSRFGGASCLLDGTGDWLESASSADWNLGPASAGNDFTIELWVRYNSVAGTQGLVTACDNANSGWQVYTDGTKLYLRTGAAPPSVSWVPSTNTWYHLALVRSGTTCTFFVNGTSLGTVTNQDMNNDGQALALGAMDANGASPFNGWIDDVRITKGVARYTGNFTPPTAAFPDS